MRLIAEKIQSFSKDSGMSSSEKTITESGKAQVQEVGGQLRIKNKSKLSVGE